jgi:histidine ammonia-lyase
MIDSTASNGNATNGDVKTARSRGKSEVAGRPGRLILGDSPLDPATLWRFAQLALDPAKRVSVDYSAATVGRIQEASNLLEKIVASEEPVYGVNTGFGHFANVAIEPEKVAALQKNIVRSHCTCVGEPLSRDLVMALCLISLNTLCQGHSGVRYSTIRSVGRMLEAGILGWVPSQGSVGASGDLGPGAHAMLPLLGEGYCTMPIGARIERLPAASALHRAGMDPVELGPKEGLSLINGTHLTTALAVKAWYEGDYLLKVANLAAAMTIEALGGDRMTSAEPTMRAHGHPGTIECGRALRYWLGEPSELSDRHRDTHWIQDPYSLRCVPQVHGAVWEELDHSETVLEREINAITDNPLLFPDEGMVRYCGNFHAIYPGRVSDRLASAFATLANISERRISQAMRPPRGHLPTFLIHDGGLNSGLMMAHVTAAALVSEAKSLSFPATVDSIPTNVTQEDHVSMGPVAGFKTLRILENLRRVLAIELLTAAQALYLCRPFKASPRIEEVYARIRDFVPPMDEDRVLTDDIDTITAKIHSREILPA